MSEFVKQIKPHFERATIPLINIFSKANISPHILTLSGLAFTAIASYFIYTYHFFWAGVLLAIGGFFDALDGHLARKSGKVSTFGAFLDSTVDRIADFLPLSALVFVFKDDDFMLAFILMAILFSFLVSYARARAEGLGLRCTVGFFERPERLIILIISLITGFIKIGIIVLAIGSFITFLQRVLYVLKQEEINGK